MAAWLILFVGIVYIAVAIGLCLQGKVGLAIAFAGYAVANYGLYLEALK